MSDNKDNFDTQVETKASNSSTHTKKPVTISKENVVEVAKKRSAKDLFLWLIAIISLVSATLVSHYLPRFWAPANDIWVQIGITVALVVLAILCLAFTHQGSAFKTLLKDAGIELKRVTWPTKDETIKYTWQVMLVMLIIGIIIWLLDSAFNRIIAFVLH